MVGIEHLVQKSPQRHRRLEDGLAKDMADLAASLMDPVARQIIGEGESPCGCVSADVWKAG